MNTPTILLLDDDANTLITLRAILERTAAQVVESEDERGAIDWCRQSPASIDLLVADVILPYSSGPEVVRKVKPLQPRMRLLFISGFGLGELDRRGLLHHGDLSPGRVEFLQKPFTAEAFLASVHGLLLS